ncbi:MAG: excinuclease ABC subunit UvrC [Candidatus Altiarchaeota archaeon]|nr:excinuclease ABC subunit UvrC [Candidatus Altiarchaeota archaeon]
MKKYENFVDTTTPPKDPGCYLFKNKDGKIIYIGKAKSLKKRIKSYFKTTYKDQKTRVLASKIQSVDFFVTKNEVEALILENNLIRKHKPKFNIDLKESKRYAYLVLTDENFPKLLTVRNKKLKGKYFGPFTSGEYREILRKLLTNNFGIRTCNKMPKRACLRFHIKLCDAPCEGKISKRTYQKNAKKVKRFLDGKTTKLIEQLETEMNTFSKKLLFETAKTRRDQIDALKYLNIKQNMEREKKHDENVINYILSEGKVYTIVFNLKKGVLTTKNEFSFEGGVNFFEEFLKAYYSENPVPKEIIIPKKLNDLSIKKYLEKIRGKKVSLSVPRSGAKKELLELVKRNIEVGFLKQNTMVSSLKTELNLNSTPKIIETFDVSHTGGTNVVGAMVRFTDAKPDKSNYRKFKMKSFQSNDDFLGIYEIVKRRYTRLKESKDDFPDLIVIDGGIGQLNAALKALNELSLKLPIIGLAKQFEEVYLPNKSKPLRLKKDSLALKLLILGRDEAHRFAVKYHRLLRSKGMKGE